MATERLAAVTEKLNKIEEERSWLLSEEGKAASKQLREAELRLKKEKDLQDKRAKMADKEEDYKNKAIDRAEELERLEDEIREAKSKTARKDRKDEKKYNKQEAKLREKLEKEKRDFGKEFYDSIFGTYSLIGSLKNIFPKPVQILAGWGLDKFKKGIVGASKKIGSIAKSGFNAMMGGEPDADASPEAKAAAAEVKPTEAAIPKSKLKDTAYGKGWDKIWGGKGGDGGAGADGAPAEVIPLDSIAGDADASLDELKKQTALLTTMVDAMEGPDASKTGEGIIEKADPTGTDIDIDIEKGGGFKKIMAAIGVAIALIAAPFVFLLSFFKSFGKETAKLARGFGRVLGKALAPLKNFFGKNSVIAKAVQGISNIFKSISATVKGSRLPGMMARVGKVVKDGMALIGRIFRPLVNVFRSIAKMGKAAVGMSRMASGIVKFAAGFGRILGKIFWPITLIMGVFDFITGFIDGFKEDGILGGLEGGLSKMIGNLIGMPLDLLKKGIAWIAGKLGFENAKVWLESFSFTDLLKGMISGIFDTIKAAVEWIKLLFTNPVDALKKLWEGLLGTFKSISDIIMWPINTAIDWIMGIFGLKEEGAPKFSLWDYIFGADGIIASVWNWIKGIFGFGGDEEGEEGGETLWDWIKGIPGKIWGWIKGIFSFTKPTTPEGEEEQTLWDWIKGIPGRIWKWFKGIFTFGGDEKQEGEETTTLWGWLKGIPGRIWNWIKGIFGFGEEDPEAKEAGKGFSLWSIVTDSIAALGKWFADLFDIDWSQLIADMTPQWVKDLPFVGKWFGGTGEVGDAVISEAVGEHGQTLKGAKEAGLYDEDAIGASEINREALQAGVKSGAVQKEMLQAIIDDKDLRDEDLAFMEQLVKQATTPGSLYVHDMELAKILRKGFGMPETGDVGSIAPPDTVLTPGNDIAAASSNMFGGSNSSTNVVNAPVTTTNSSSSTVVNVQTPKMATDPNTQKQSGYALSGWAKFD